MPSRTRFTDIAVVIPAYNESGNLKVLTGRILKAYPGITVVIVDDSNAEENARLKAALKGTEKQVTILTRAKKMGRGSAVLDGLKHAAKQPNITTFFEMDADLAHNPDELPRFLEKTDSTDLVVGSRYREGSKILKWPLARVIQSKIINFALRYWLHLNLTDYTNGYRAYSRRAVEFLINQPLRERGYIALSEMAFKLKRAGFTLDEVPITFKDRELGTSNATWRELLASLVGVIRIRLSA